MNTNSQKKKKGMESFCIFLKVSHEFFLWIGSGGIEGFFYFLTTFSIDLNNILGLHFD